MKILVLGVDHLNTWVLINYLQNHFSTQFIIIKKQNRIKILYNKFLKQKYIITIGQILFIIYAKLFISYKKKYISKLLEKNNLNKAIKIQNSNKIIYDDSDDLIIKKINQFEHDLIIINGTKILSKQIINSSKSPIINIHCGITPNYRGVHGGYWALYNLDYKNCGVTVHLVDETIDGGNILVQKKVNFTKNDNFNTYPIVQYIAALNPLKNLLEKSFHKSKFNFSYLKKENAISKIYGHPTILHYFIGLLKGIK